MTTNLRSWLAVIALSVALVGPAACGVPEGESEELLSAPPGFLGRRGAQLVLDGKEFREISFNKFDLWWQFQLERETAANEALRLLGDKGFRVIRVMTGPFYPAEFSMFFDNDAQKQQDKRRDLFARFDRMLDACDRHGIRVVATLVWNLDVMADLGHHSLHEGLTNPRSPARGKVDEWVRAVVGRYQDRPTIAMWEIGNEWDLAADLAWPGGVLNAELSRARPDLYPPPVVRDDSNNFSADNLHGFFRSMAKLIRTMDRTHLITTGVALRPSAWHQRQTLRAGPPIDWDKFWTDDSPSEARQILRLLHPAPIGVISIHYYDNGMGAFGGSQGNADNLRTYKRIADQMGKPLFVGEIGLHGDIKGGYNDPAALELLGRTLPVLVDSRVPLTLYWTFHAEAAHHFALEYGKTDEALRLIEQAAAKARH